MTHPIPRTVVVLRDGDDVPALLDGRLDHAGRALGIAVLAPAVTRPTGSDLARWPFVLEAVLDDLGRERFSLLTGGGTASLGLAVAFVLPHRAEALGVVAPGPLPAPATGIDPAGLTVPTLVWTGGRAAEWVATVPGALLQPHPRTPVEILRRVLAAGETSD